MGVNKVNYAGRTLIDISDATVTPETLAAGATAYNAAGALITGTLAGLPVGTIFAYAGDTPPEGALSCDHGEINRATYANLFSIIGTKYGAGNGSTTFNLPNLNNGSFLEGGSTAGAAKEAGLPNITGQYRVTNTSSGANSFTDAYISNGIATSGALSVANSGVARQTIGNGGGATTDIPDILNFNAQGANAIYGKSATVQPKSVTVKFCIKY